MIANAKTDKQFISEQSTCYPLFVHPESGVRKAPSFPFFTHDGGLAEMMQPGNCQVPIGVTISDHERDQLSVGVRSFFRNMLRPVIKHV